MLRFISRFIGYWFLAGALVAAVMDGAKTIAANSLTLTPLADVAKLVAPTAFDTLHAASAPFWAPLANAVLGCPAWLVLGVVGSLLILIGTLRRRETIGWDAAV
ncbi:hypothetical protein [Faunimonas pinastri]|nr:hypothetical protein [Faunimonas pinastri]